MTVGRRTLWVPIVLFAAAVAVCLAVAGAAVILTPTKQTPTATVDPEPTSSAVRRREETPPPNGSVVIREIRPTRRNSAELLSEMKDKDAELRARIERVKSQKATPVDEKRRMQEEHGKHGERGNSASGTKRTDGSPTLEELLANYERSAEEQRIVDRWLAEYTVWLGRINRAGLRGDKTEVAELTAAMKDKLPYGITDFCRDEIGMKKLLAAVSQGRTSIDGRRLELLLRYHRDGLKKLLGRLTADELAKWR